MGSRMWVWGGGPDGNEWQILLFVLWLIVGWISIYWIGVSAYLIIALILLILCFIPFPLRKIKKLYRRKIGIKV